MTMHPPPGRAAMSVTRTCRDGQAGPSLTERLAVATTAAFAGGGLLSQTVIVPGWRAMDPAAFLPHFARYGPITGGAVFGFEIASVLLLGRISYRTRRRGRAVWALAWGCMLGTLATLGYFLPTNLDLLDPAYPTAAVPATLASWYRWNWVRVGLGLAGAALTCAAPAGRRPAVSGQATTMQAAPESAGRRDTHG